MYWVLICWLNVIVVFGLISGLLFWKLSCLCIVLMCVILIKWNLLLCSNCVEIELVIDLVLMCLLVLFLICFINMIGWLFVVIVLIIGEVSNEFVIWFVIFCRLVDLKLILVVLIVWVLL